MEFWNHKMRGPVFKQIERVDNLDFPYKITGSTLGTTTKATICSKSSFAISEFVKALIRFTALVILFFHLLWAVTLVAQGNTGIKLTSSALRQPQGDADGFLRMDAAATGVQFTNYLSDALMIRNINLLNGSGLAVGDFDKDGLLDLFFSGLQSPSALYRNLGGWRFQDVTEKAGVANPRSLSTGAAFVDVNADGWPDLVSVAMGGPNSIFINQRNGTFKDIGQEAGITSQLGATSMAFADVDQDGDLDYYQCYYGVVSLLKNGGALNIVYRNGKPVVRGRHADRIRFIDGFMMELGEPDELFLNDGTGKFKAVDWMSGRFLSSQGDPINERPWDQGLSVRFSDLNQDGLPDLYICNDGFTPDRIWLNQGQGIFKEPDPFAFRKSSYFSMGMDVADLDLDLQDDLLVVDMLSQERELYIGQQSMTPRQKRLVGLDEGRPQHRRNMLYKNRGDGTYAETAWFAGIAGTEWSWSPIFMDVDLDGRKDLLVSNGFPHDVDDIDTQNKITALGKLSIRDSQKTLLLYPKLDTPNRAFRNDGGMKFTEVGEQWGFDSKAVSNGMVKGDLDGDGDLDVVINCFNSEAELYQNTSAGERVQVRLREVNSKNPDAIGARIQLVSGSITQAQEVIAGGRYMSGESPEQTFAFPDPTREARIIIHWPDGQISRHGEIRSGRRYEVVRDLKLSAPAASDISSRVSQAKEAKGWFVEMETEWSLQHPELEEDDFSQQPMTLAKRSQDGPGVAVFDWDGDGLDDLLMPSGKNGSDLIYKNSGAGRFESVSPSESDATFAPADGLGVVAWKTQGKITQWLVSRDFERDQVNATHLAKQKIARPDLQGNQPSFELNGGSMAVGDWNQDGALDLFVGGRPVPGRFPEYSESWIYLSRGPDEGEWRSWSSLLRGGGETGSALRIVSAVFSDIDNDGWVELVLAEEWGRVRIMEWNPAPDGTPGIQESAGSISLKSLTGLWRGIASADLDNDGDMDLALGNLGWNTRRGALDHGKELRLYFGDSDRNGKVENWEIYWDDKLQQYYPFESFQAALKSLPAWQNRFESHKAYARVSAEALFAHESTSDYQQLSVNNLGVLILWNEGDGAQWSSQVLPDVAQWSPAFGVTIEDWNGDGYLDLFLAQNFFALPESEAGFDAGTGLLIENQGSRTWNPLNPQESGIQVFGEQRGSAVGDFNADGRPDLLVAQNGAELKIYLNSNGDPGLRVKINGGTSNPWGVGHRVRLKFENGWGTTREVQFGSGYLSQNSGYIILRKPALQAVGYLGALSGLEWTQPGNEKKWYPLTDTEWESKVASGAIWELK